jgi:hypothetical protein
LCERFGVRFHLRRILVGALAAALLPVAVSSAGSETTQIDDLGASATAVASRSGRVSDVVSVNETSVMSAATIAQAQAAAAAVGAQSALGSAAQIGMTLLARNGAPVQQPPAGLRIPMGLTVLPIDAAGGAMSQAVGSTLAEGSIVIGALSAGMRGAQAGDDITLLDESGNGVTYRIGRVASDVEAGGAELVMTPEQAARVGATEISRVVMWGFTDRAGVDAALSAAGLERAGVRISRSWGPANPDSALGVAPLKALAGEFSFKPNSDGSATLNAGWSDANIVRRNYTGVGLRASCNVAIVDAIQGALDEIAAAGLAGEINTANSNTYGGCFNPRFNRVTGNLGFLSRHSWGAALDINTTQNPQGSTPKLNCGVVRIFRKWGFAWGGNFVNPDGMHFEYVGEPRDTLSYPSRWCPNIIPASADRAERRMADASGSAAARSALFVDDGFSNQ